MTPKQITLKQAYNALDEELLRTKGISLQDLEASDIRDLLNIFKKSDSAQVAVRVWSFESN